MSTKLKTADLDAATALDADLAELGAEPVWQFRLVFADISAQSTLQAELGLAGIKQAGYVCCGGLQFADFRVQDASFGAAVGRMIDAVESFVGGPRVLRVERLTPILDV